ncbi:MAG: MBL fold metallo-hydrolase [Thermodesulfobacteriota bacterium]|jgi:7,8-dihydropterin-6-yl-methyl-4-(beta-D-ribofuranosyl)aminobenzene 5'-phosphate synthase|nr:MAG: MBL fold metallo-hydrolase [Thermodesulfobacteriota bacterium]
MVTLRESEKIEVVTVIDNYTDCLIPSSQKVRRCPHYKNGKVAPPLLAEHGLSLLVRVFKNGNTHTLLLDAGWSATGVFHNLKELGINIDEIEAVVLSHGHMDHYGSLRGILKLISEPIPVIVHPDVFLQNRFLILPDGEKITFPTLNESTFQKNVVKIIKNTEPYLLAEELVLVTGEIERTTNFEKGILNAYVDRRGKIERDLIMDDQGLIVHLKDKGLVIITGCAHSGIINTVRYAQKVTGIDPVYAVIGGFHLSGTKFEAVIHPTLEEIKRVNPFVISPMHCTGFKATMEIAKNMPRQFVLSSVGSTLLL